MKRKYYRPKRRRQAAPQEIFYAGFLSLGLLIFALFSAGAKIWAFSFLALLIISSAVLAIYFVLKQEKIFKKRRELELLDFHDVDKMSGIEFEDFMEFIFSENGFKVKTTATSGDYGVDLLIYKDEIWTAVQCKRYKDSVGVKAVQEAISGMNFYNCQKSMVVTSGVFTKNAKIMAQKLGCELVDRENLAKIINETRNKK